MKLSFPREIPRRAALVVVALALIASVVAGREELSTDPQAAQEPATAPAMNGAAPQAIPDLDLDKLNRSVRSNRITDLFASKAAALPPPPVAIVVAPPPPPPPPAPPSAPPLPFRYFGKWIDGDRTVVFLWNASEGHSVAAGDTVEGAYRIEAITDSSIDFVYLPLGSKQTLPISKPE